MYDSLMKINQVLACDPEDMVIADTASAKSGLAVTIELGDSAAALDLYTPPKVPFPCLVLLSMYRCSLC